MRILLIFIDVLLYLIPSCIVMVATHFCFVENLSGDRVKVVRRKVGQFFRFFTTLWTYGAELVGEREITHIVLYALNQPVVVCPCFIFLTFYNNSVAVTFCSHIAPVPYPLSVKTPPKGVGIKVEPVSGKIWRLPEIA